MHLVSVVEVTPRGNETRLLYAGPLDNAKAVFGFGKFHLFAEIWDEAGAFATFDINTAFTTIILLHVNQIPIAFLAGGNTSLESFPFAGLQVLPPICQPKTRNRGYSWSTPAPLFEAFLGSKRVILVYF